MLYALLAIAGILSFISARNTFYPLKWVAGFSWLALLLYWLTNPVPAIARGDPTDVAIMLILIMLSMLFLLWGMAGRKGKGMETVEERYSSAGKLVDRIVKSTSNKQAPTSPGRETASEYRDRVHRAYTGSKTNRKK